MMPHWGLKCWSLLLAAWALSSCNQVSFGEWKAMLLIPCITSITATMAMFFYKPNERSCWGKRLYPIHLVINILSSCTHLLVSVHMGYKYLHIICPFRELYPHTTPADLLITYSPIIFLLSPWPFSQTTDHGLWVYVDSCFSISPPNQINSQVHSLHFCPWGKFHFTIVLQGCPRKELSCHSCPHFSGACISYRTNCKPHSHFLLLSQLFVGPSCEAIGVGWEREK